MEDESAKKPESDGEERSAQDARGDQPEDEAPAEDEHDSERLDIESFDIDGVEVGEGAREPDAPSNTQGYHELEPGPTEVVSFASPRSRVRLEEPLEDDDTEGSLVRLPSLRRVQIVVFILINLIVLILGAYVIYRSLGTGEETEESRLEAPHPAPQARGATARLPVRPVPRNDGQGGVLIRHTVTDGDTPLRVLDGGRCEDTLRPWPSARVATLSFRRTYSIEAHFGAFEWPCGALLAIVSAKRIGRLS